MAKRTKIPEKIKSYLFEEAGMKCANPGCNNYRTHIHHIKEWSVYQTHDSEHMIAVCPSCHDEIHYGKLTIDDETVYLWKNIKREKSNRDHLYIEPSYTSKLLLGSISVTGDNGVKVFELTNNTKLTYRIEDEDIFLMNLSISNQNGKEVLKVIENHVKYIVDDKINFERRPGRFKITTNRIIDFIPIWSMPIIHKMQPNYKIVDGVLTLTDVEVLKPGLVKVEGLWARNDVVIIITNDSLNFIKPGYSKPLSLIGEGENSVLKWSGKIDSSMFRFN
ncbi:HNH endonuclease [Bacillus timonensis]|uniref:HNH endonuclease n=1 Tax=Bacillus timonensis TaxID=1033734 RepID=A0A4S3PUN7_9BACI|nr:HNH endonuclease signature motif containing protein [Bacillus timonensis]THE13086.1 HNH endonuclease [Bacillus timonensis]